MANTHVEKSEHALNVYLFKNGYGMIVKTFEFPPNSDNNNTSLELLNVPSKPVHGTLWIQSVCNKTSINCIRAKKTRQPVEKECSTLEELLIGNIGQDVQVLVANSLSNNSEWVSGRIKSIMGTQMTSSADDDEKSNEDTSNPTLSVNPRAYASAVFPAYPSSTPSFNKPTEVEPGNLVLLDTNDNMLQGLPLSSIRSIRGTALKTTYQNKIFKTSLTIDYKNHSDSNDTGLMKYLTKDITWAPSYNLTILTSNDPKMRRLRLSSKAVILNDIEDITVDNLYCIVGFPNIAKFASVTDPIISGATVDQFLNQLKLSEASSSGSPFSNSSFQNQYSVMTQQVSLMQPQSMFNTTANQYQDDTSVDDLHLYEFKNISLRRKERMMLPIFDIELSYKDIYHCKIHKPHQNMSIHGVNEEKPYEEVWHSIEFENLSEFVWTTGPVIVTKGQLEQQLLGQDTLTYTLRGLSACIKLTKALNILVQFEEKVFQTSSKRITLFGAAHQADEIEGKILISNHKSERIVVVINAMLYGKLSKFSIEPQSDVIGANENITNPKHDVRWEMSVEPRETVDIKFNRVYYKRL